MTHEDERRTLTSIPYKEGEIKIIVAKQDCELGNHYHKIKTEHFKLLMGGGIAIINDKRVLMNRSEFLHIEPEMRHSFALKKDSILYCTCSHPYDKNDDYEY